MSRFANLTERLRAELPDGSSSRLAAHRIAHDAQLSTAEERAAKRIGSDAVAMLRQRATNGSAGALDELDRLGISAKAPTASSAKAETPASEKALTKAPAASKAPIKSLAAQGADAANARILAVMNHTASAGKKKAAAHMLHFSKSSAAEIISKLETAETDASIEARETWERVIAKQNAAITAINPDAVSAADNQPKPRAPTGDAIQDMWARAFVKIGVAA